MLTKICQDLEHSICECDVFYFSLSWYAPDITLFYIQVPIVGLQVVQLNMTSYVMLSYTGLVYLQTYSFS